MAAIVIGVVMLITVMIPMPFSYAARKKREDKKIFKYIGMWQLGMLLTAVAMSSHFWIISGRRLSTSSMSLVKLENNN